MRLFNVAVWTECTDAIITDRNDCKDSKDSEIHWKCDPTGNPSWCSAEPEGVPQASCVALKGRRVFAEQELLRAPCELLCVLLSAQPPQVHQGGISTLGTHFTALQVHWNNVLCFLKHSLLLSQRGWDHHTDVVSVKHKTLPNLISFPLLYALGRGPLLVVFSI